MRHGDDSESEDHNSSDSSDVPPPRAHNGGGSQAPTAASGPSKSDNSPFINFSRNKGKGKARFSSAGSVAVNEGGPSTTRQGSVFSNRAASQPLVDAGPSGTKDLAIWTRYGIKVVYVAHCAHIYSDLIS